MQSPKVSVSLITYNHAPFIEQAIEGVLRQKTNFPIELVIGEDESSDGTREIVRRYADAHPELIRAHFHSRSSNISYQGRATGRHNFVNNLRSARGEYIALLDGDDYWIDPNKLQQQVDFLDSHPACSTCFHRVSVVDVAGKELRQSPVVGPDQSTYTVSDLLRRRFFTNAPSVMFRRGLFGDFPEWYFRVPVGDFALHVLNGMKGDFGFLNRVMSAYRVHGGGIWSLGTTDETHVDHQSIMDQRRLRQMLGAVHLYEILNEELAPRFANEFRESIAFYAHEAAHILRRTKDWPALRNIMPKVWKSRPFPPEVPLVSALALTIQGYLPFTATVADRLRGMSNK
jgi:glycosyltransferase involved in cell wall biosynthesis